MRTPREILLARNQSAGPKLDVIREGIVASLAEVPVQSLRREKSPTSFLEFLLSLRWHAAAMGAVWLFAVLVGSEPSPGPKSSVARGASTLPPREYVFLFREYQRELAELIDPPAREQEPIPEPHASVLPRRRENSIYEIA